MSDLEERWTASVASWAGSRADVKALVQVGSRVQPGAAPDAWSDFDYQLVTSDPDRYRSGSFLGELGACWARGAEEAFGGVRKLTGVYEGALEADFIIVPHLQMRIAMLALKWPGASGLWPESLKAGIGGLRGVAGSGWKVVKGGRRWEERYSRVCPMETPLSEAELAQACGDFWIQLVWAAKKAERGEFVAAQRTYHRYLVEGCLRLHEQAALQDGRKAYPRGRRAEAWMTPAQLAVLAAAPSTDRGSLLRALVLVADEFTNLSGAVAARKNWRLPDHSKARSWLAGL